MFDYCSQLTGWESWQKDYRWGVILILPPAAVTRQIDPLRAHYDPQAFRICRTHISISDPLAQALTPALDGEISGILASIQPFTLTYDQPLASRDYAGVAYPITPQEPIDFLKERLHQAAAFDPQPYSRRDIPAHMTIAEFVTIERSWQIVAEIEDTAPSGSFLCDRLSYLIPDREFSFQQVKTYPLGR